MLSLSSIIDYFNTVINELAKAFFNPASFLSFGPLIVAFAIAFCIVAYRMRAKSKGRRVKLKHVIRTLFPRSVFWHKSAKTDYSIYIINNGFLFFVTLSVLITPTLFAEAILKIFSIQGLYPTETDVGWTERIALTLVMVLAWDFGATYAHYLKHKVPLLWEFHKVHHSAEVMTPITAMRRHPIDGLFGAFVTIISIGVALAFWHLVVGHGAGAVTIFGSWAGIYIWRLLGYNLRHTHIWISYGDFWNRIFISPAQHQVHHSIDSKHYDTNFGHIFSFWDAILGTLYLPKHEERVKFGIAAEDMDDMQTLRGIYFSPFVKCGNYLKNIFVKPRESESRTTKVQ